MFVLNLSQEHTACSRAQENNLYRDFLDPKQEVIFLSWLDERRQPLENRETRGYTSLLYYASKFHTNLVPFGRRKEC
jgi:hypothetical protein